MKAADFTYAGSSVIRGSVGADLGYGTGLTHRWVGGQLRFLLTAYNGGKYDLIEIAMPPALGQPITSRTNTWPGKAVWNFRPDGLAGHLYNFWWEDLGGGKGRLWGTMGVNYPPTGYIGLTSAITVRDIRDDGSVGPVRGVWGLQGVSQRCIRGGMDRTPRWLQQQGWKPYTIGPGGYASLAVQGGLVSAGLFLADIPDPTTYTPPKSYPPAGYANNGSDWSIRAGAFGIRADHRSGNTPRDWYGSGNPVAPPFDRGVRLSPVTNYFDGGDNRPNPSSPPNFPPRPGARWLSPAPDKRNRWVWQDYYCGPKWIDGPNKTGVVCLFSGSGGKAWYQGSTTWSDFGVAEIHVFDPTDLMGKKQAWNVQPSAMLDVTADLHRAGAATGSHNNEHGNPSGITWVPELGMLFAFSGGIRGGGDSLLSAWKVRN